MIAKAVVTYGLELALDFAILQGIVGGIMRTVGRACRTAGMSLLMP